MADHTPKAAVGVPGLDDILGGGLARSRVYLLEGASSHGWTLPDNLEVFELLPSESLLDEDLQQSLLYSSDLELGETTKRIFERYEQVRPDRIVLDSLSEIRLLAQSSLRYRRQILALKHYFAKHGATVLMLDDLTAESADKTVHSVAHGVIRLEELSPDYGAERRRLRVLAHARQTILTDQTPAGGRPNRKIAHLHQPPL